MIENINNNFNPFKELDGEFDRNIDETFLEKSNKQYYDCISQCKSLDDSSQGRLVSNILLNLIESLEKYLLKMDRIDYIKNNLDWDFHLLDSSFKNAFCMVGGKILVYSGILSIADNEEKIAYILAHEIAHTLLNHPRSHIIVKDKDYNSVLLFKPFSQKEEFEADRLALMMLHWADYDISRIPSYCMDLKINDNGFNFFSTHPLSEKRINNMKLIVNEINNLEDSFVYPVIRNSTKSFDDEFNKNYYNRQKKDYHASGGRIKCKNCGYYVDSDSSFCTHCGAKLKEDYKDLRKIRSDGVLKCGRCGARVNKDDSFCTHCGNVLVDRLECSNCGARINPGDVFCVHCGIKL